MSFATKLPPGPVSGELFDLLTMLIGICGDGGDVNMAVLLLVKSKHIGIVW